MLELRSRYEIKLLGLDILKSYLCNSNKHNMKILHCCLSNFYIDNYGYQENVLPKMHKLQGHDVAILASTETFVDNSELGYIEPSSYLTREGIPITRIPYVKWLPHTIAKKIRMYTGITKHLNEFEPDIIFLHQGQFMGVRDIVSYVKTNPNVKVYVDNHADYINSASNWVSMNILHKIIYKRAIKLIEPYTQKFYGVLPIRVDFLKDVYGTPPAKTELLVLGIDDSNIDFKNRESIRADVRKDLGIGEHDFVIITGGKIDTRKNIHLLMQAIIELEDKNIKLIVFGKPTEEVESEFNNFAEHERIFNVGWITPERANDYFFASDLACFPGTHSVLWEQSVGLGLPAIFKRWDGIEHIDIGGNCIFLEDVSVEIIKKILLEVYRKDNLYQSMKESAKEGIKIFSYYEIAKRAIES